MRQRKKSQVSAGLWKKGRSATHLQDQCTGCSFWFPLNEWGYLSPDDEIFCTRCAVDRGAVVEKSQDEQAKIDRFVERLFSFAGDEIKRRIK